MKSIEVGHSIENEIEHKKKYQSALHVYYVELQVCVCMCCDIKGISDCKLE